MIEQTDLSIVMSD